jgi:hypothetical protein
LAAASRGSARAGSTFRDAVRATPSDRTSNAFLGRDTRSRELARLRPSARSFAIAMGVRTDARSAVRPVAAFVGRGRPGCGLPTLTLVMRSFGEVLVVGTGGSWITCVAPLSACGSTRTRTPARTFRPSAFAQRGSDAHDAGAFIVERPLRSPGRIFAHVVAIASRAVGVAFTRRVAPAGLPRASLGELNRQPADA